LDINNLLHASSWQDVEQLVNYIGAESLLHEAFSSLCFFFNFYFLPSNADGFAEKGWCS